MRVLVIGAYGFIGATVSRELLRSGHQVIGLGRNLELAQRLLPELEWQQGDLASLTSEESWRTYLAGVDVVVNTSGVLQDSSKDDVATTQQHAIMALIKACEQLNITRYIQISAPGAIPSSATAFMRTKALADAALRASSLEWVIFKPGLVMSRNAYGGTALLRMLAAFPLAQPTFFQNKRVQTVAVEDVTAAVVLATAGHTPVRQDFDLVEPQPERLESLIIRLRKWLGFSAPRLVIPVPMALIWFLAKAGDLAGMLGWRPALRTTSVRVLEDEIVGDPIPWQQATGLKLLTLAESLSAMPTTLQERVAVRILLLMPLALLGLSLFWLFFWYHWSGQF